jgi:hypothetical protein
MSPSWDDWTEERLAGNPPRLFRLRQLVALFQAFGIPWDSPSFARGGFITPTNRRYDALLAKLATEMQDRPRGTTADGHQLPEFFGILFSYRERIDHVLSFSSGVMAASGLYRRAHRTASKLTDVIEDNIAIIEEPLIALISPEGAVFSVEELVRDYGYSDVNVGEIDDEWW